MSNPRSLIQPYLAPGEVLLWVGKPQQGLAFQSIDLFLVPFAIVWAGIPTYAFLFGTQKSPAGPLNLVPLIFIFVGAYLVAGRFMLDAWRRARMIYAVTESRAIIVSPGFSNSVTSFDLTSIPGLRLEEFGQGRGTIELGAPLSPWTRNQWPSTAPKTAFFRIEQAKMVFDLMRKARVSRT